ncbi:MAG: HNH endonuclease [Proteobacteria bacterium]|nr:HNH endonuclease [Pseudomonadota bacterium]
MNQAIRPCTKCAGVNFGTWQSSSTGGIKLYCRTCRDNRRAAYEKRKVINGGLHTKNQWLEKLRTYDACPRCGRQWAEIPKRPNPRYRNVWTKDHIVPLSRGGTDDISNIQPLCYQCNFGKNAGT